MKNERIRCDACGRFISFQDLENNVATHTMVLPDSDYSIETWESTCKICSAKEQRDVGN